MGYVEGCTDSVALNYLDIASVDDGSCEYFCPESINDIVDYSCMGESYPMIVKQQLLMNLVMVLVIIIIPMAYVMTKILHLVVSFYVGEMGEYAYMPPQRYIHNLEHGGIAFISSMC